MRTLGLSGIAFLQLTAALLLAQPQGGTAKPQVTPVFFEEKAPAFLLECRNTTQGAIRPMRTGDMMRIDGQLPTASGYGTSGPQQPLIEPGGSWKEIAVLHASRSVTARTPSFGAIIRSDSSVVLTPGRHTVAFQCGGTWSDESAFYWDESLR
jgi:hypothetical protein